MALWSKKSMLALLAVIVVAAFFVVHYRVHTATGGAAQATVFVVAEGDNALAVARGLETRHLIEHRFYFLYYFWKEKLRGKIVAGTYLIDPSLTVPDIAQMITQGSVMPNETKLTFPEGWDRAKMAERLAAQGFSRADFLDMTNAPFDVLRTLVPALTEIPQGQSLEGYLFPDTYLFARDATAEEIVTKMVRNFDKMVTQDVRDEIARQGKTLYDVVTLASIVENEVRTKEDREIVAGIFWNRLAQGQAFQSDATIKYILGKNKIQHSFEETRTESLYNTYVHTGLPPGPIGNPGMEAILAVVYPKKTSYNYFLNNPTTGATVFAETFEQHVRNKAANGL